MKLTKGIGSSFDDFLEEEELLAPADAIAIKRVLAYQLRQMMEKEHISKSEMAKKMHTSRTSINRLLDPSNASITLATMESAASAIGKRLRIELV